MMSKCWPLLALAALPSFATASFICDPTTCLGGTNALSAGASLGSDVQLLPGSYSASSAPFTQTNGTVQAGSGVANAIASTGFSVNGQTVSQQSGIVLYPLQLYQGDANFTAPSSLSSPNGTSVPERRAVTSTSSNGTLSFLLSSNLQAVLTVPTTGDGQIRVVAYDSAADVTQWGVGAEGGLVADLVEGAGCAGGCGIRGVCSLQGVCSCTAGFTGPRCDSCANGFFGRNCSQCQTCGAGQSCDAGLDGSGQCVGAGANGTATALETCNCLNGSCDGATCACSPGWTTSANGTQCAVCAPGFFQDQTGACVPCSPGCATCTSPQGACTLCAPSLQISPTDPTACQPAPFTSVGAANPQACLAGFFNSNNASCQPCDASCATCSAAGPGGCTKCSSSTGLFIAPPAPGASGGTGACVAVDASSGACENPVNSAGATTQPGQFLLNSATGVCDPAPPLCAVASVPNFSTTAKTPQAATCSACVPGAALSQGKCLASCPASSFNNNGTCDTCDSSCSSCAGTSTTCTACSSTSDFLGSDGRCVSKCPDGTFSGVLNATTVGTGGVFGQAPAGAKVCFACSGSCATCSGSTDRCLSCPSSRPVLDPSAATCSTTCSGGRTQFFDQSKGRCGGCDASCASCSGSGDGDCLSCKDGSVLKAGKCVPAQCQAGRDTVAGFGVCLETLLTIAQRPKLAAKSNKVPVPAIVGSALGALAAVAGALASWRCNLVRKRKAKTDKFGDGVYNQSTDVKLQELNVNVDLVAPRSPRVDESAVPDWRREEELVRSHSLTRSQTEAATLHRSVTEREESDRNLGGTNPFRKDVR